MLRPTLLSMVAFFALGAQLYGCSDEPPLFTSMDGSVVTDTGNVTEDVDPALDTGFPADRGVIPIRDNGPVLGATLVYAHSDDELYSVDADNNNRVVRIGAFRWPSGNHTSMTDLAVDAEGNVVACSRDTLYRVDVTNAQLTRITTFSGQVFYGLTYLPAGTFDANAETLVGATSDGTYYRINPTNGQLTRLGRFQNNWALSGDIVSVQGDRTYATVRQASGGGSNNTDRLVELNPLTGSVRVIGDTGFSSIYGLGYWRQTLYGFTRAGEIITINVQTGRGTRVSMPTMEFSGAGVTTTAPITPG